MSKPSPGSRHSNPNAIPAVDGPRERLLDLGARALSDSELVALLFRTGRQDRDSLALARDVLARHGGLVGTVDRSPRELCGLPGVGMAKAASLVAAIEIGRRLAAPRLRVGSAVGSPADVHRHCFPRLRDRAQEHFVALLLDGRHRLSSEVEISRGTLTASLVHPREVFRAAIRDAAAAIVLVHNHPSGDPAPSREDRDVTDRLSRAGELLGVRVLDHVIVAEGGYYSFAEARGGENA